MVQHDQLDQRDSGAHHGREQLRLERGVVAMSNQAWKTATRRRLPRPSWLSHAKIHDATQMLAAKPTNPTAGIAR